MRSFRRGTARRPWGLQWRSNMWFATLVAFLGLMSDTIVYTIVIPIMPFKLTGMGHKRVSGLIGWLLFAYSAGVVLSTLPFAYYSERFKNRQFPLVFALVALILSQLLLMLAGRYWVMCVARFIQGISSSGVLTIGLALICDNTPKRHIGQQTGIAMAGFSIGMLAGPPIAGTLDTKFGFRAPFYFGMALASVDLIVRLLVIERKAAILWGVDPAADPDEATKLNLTNDSRVLMTPERGSRSAGSLKSPIFGAGESSNVAIFRAPANDSVQSPITPLGVLLKLLTSPRAMVCVFSTFVYGFVYSGQETILVVHLARVYDLNEYKAGLAFIAAVIPTLISMPLTGYLSDNKGAEWISFLSLLLGIPWWGVITMNWGLKHFLAIFAVETLFTSGLVSPLMTELAAVSRSIKGVGYAHVYGSFNLAYGVGTSVGPVVCGQIYDAARDGWTTISILTLCLLVVCLILSITFTGERPLLRRVLGSLSRRERGPADAWGLKELGEGPPTEHRGSSRTFPEGPSITIPQSTHWRA